MRGYFQQAFAVALIRDSYDPGRMAQVFRIESDNATEPRDAVVSTKLLDAHPTGELGTALIGLQLRNICAQAKVVRYS